MSFLDALGEYGGQSSVETKKILLILLVATCCTSVLCAVILVDMTIGWKPEYFSLNNSNKFFYHYTADSLYIAIGQCIVLPLLAWCGIKSISSASSSDAPELTKSCDCFSCIYSCNKDRYDSSFESI